MPALGGLNDDDLVNKKHKFTSQEIEPGRTTGKFPIEIAIVFRFPGDLGNIEVGRNAVPAILDQLAALHWDILNLMSYPLQHG